MRLFGEAVHHGKTETGSFAAGLGGEEGLEDALERFRDMPSPLSETEMQA